MYNRVLMYKDNIFKSIGLLVTLSLLVIFYSGVKEGYFEIFLLAMIITPMVFIINSKNSLKTDLIFAIIMALIITLYAILFWKYKDGILFGKANIMQLPEEARGSFSFENRLKLELLLMCSSIFVLLSLFLRYVFKIKNR